MAEETSPSNLTGAATGTVMIGVIQVSRITGSEATTVVETVMLMELTKMKYIFLVDSWVGGEQEE